MVRSQVTVLIRVSLVSGQCRSQLLGLSIGFLAGLTLFPFFTLDCVLTISDNTRAREIG